MALSRKSKVVVSSLKELAAAAFTKANYRTTSGSSATPSNSTISSDTKLGVLGGSVALVSGDYLVTTCTHIASGCGLFVGDAIPDNFMNAPALSSNKLGVACFGGEFEVDVFETHATSTTSQLASYTSNASLYCSWNGFLTVEAPTTQDNNQGGTGVDTVLARVTYAPTSTNLVLGLDLLV